MPVKDISDFVSVSENLATAGQPTEAQLQFAAQEGFDVVINIGLLDPRYCLEDEAATIRGLGMQYIHIPVDFQGPTSDDLQRFFQVMDETWGQKVLVHCAANKRVSSFVCLYGQAKLGWSEKEADTYLHRLWEPNLIWATFIKSARQQIAACS